MEYKIIYSNRRTLALEIRHGELLVRAPRGMSESKIDEFVSSRSAWIEKHLKKEVSILPSLSKEELDALYREAKAIIPLRVAYFAERLGVEYGRITVRCQGTRWGSCSSKGNLNFNCLLMLAPSAVLDGVVAHELCHLKEMNHSKRFYAHLLSICPDYYETKKWLKEHGEALMERVGK